MMTRLILAILLMCAFYPSQADTLRHDPFSRPLLVAPTPTTNASAPTAANPAAPVANTDIKIDPVPTWNPTLVAVMVAGKSSLVNIEGKIIRIGEEIDGYRLIKVRDGEATFSKDHQRVVLRMENQTPKDNKIRGRL